MKKIYPAIAATSGFQKRPETRIYTVSEQIRQHLCDIISELRDSKVVTEALPIIYSLRIEDNDRDRLTTDQC